MGAYGQLQPVRVDHAGQRWSGLYRLDGRCVCVESAYGSRAVDVGRRDPKAVAAAALRDLVDAWRAARRRA